VETKKDKKINIKTKNSLVISTTLSFTIKKIVSTFWLRQYLGDSVSIVFVGRDQNLLQNNSTPLTLSKLILKN